MRVFDNTEELILFLAELGGLPSAEGLAFSELDHGLQSAARVAEKDPHDEELHVAALVHDLAHPWDAPGQPRHALMAADAVRALLGERVARLVAGYVPAKRWLVTCEPAYRVNLSADSIATLVVQGGVMTAEEVAWFESLADWHAMVLLRRADDAAKVPGAEVPDLDTWIGAIRRVAARV